MVIDKWCEWFCGAFWTVLIIINTTQTKTNAALPLHPNTQQGRHVVVVLFTSLF